MAELFRLRLSYKEEYGSRPEDCRHGGDWYCKPHRSEHRLYRWICYNDQLEKQIELPKQVKRIDLVAHDRSGTNRFEARVTFDLTYKEEVIEVKVLDCLGKWSWQFMIELEYVLKAVQERLKKLGSRTFWIQVEY